MLDIYRRRFALKGAKKDVMKALRFMAENAALETNYSYLYEIFLKPSEDKGDCESYGLTENFDEAGEMDQVGFFSCGYMMRPLLAVLEYETVFNEIASQNPSVELYAEMHNEGGIQETQSYMESFYSPDGSTSLQQNYIQIYQDPDDEDFDPSEDPFLSDEAIENQYLELWGKPKSYFEALLGLGEVGNKHGFCSIAACKDILKKEMKVSGFYSDEVKERFEHIKIGQNLFLKPDESEDIMLFSEEGYVGKLSQKGNFELMTFDQETGKMQYFRDVIYSLNHMLQLIPDDICCEVLALTPLSQRRKNAKYALLCVELKISQEMIESIKQEQNAKAGFLEEVVRSIENFKKSK